MAPAPDAACNIRDDGIVYVPWQEFAKRLALAFGPGAAVMVPLEKPSVQDKKVFVRYALVVRGIFVAEAMQSHPYISGGWGMALDDAVESAKSECLRRCCKVFGGALEPWDAAWRERWKKEYAVLVMRTGKKQWAWRRKDAMPFDDERLSRESPESEYTKPSRLDDEAKQHMDSIMGQGEWTDFAGDAREEE